MPATTIALILVLAALPYGLWLVYAVGKLREAPHPDGAQVEQAEP